MGPILRQLSVREMDGLMPGFGRDPLPALIVNT